MICELKELHKCIMYADIVYIDKVNYEMGSFSEILEIPINFRYCPKCGEDLYHWRYHQLDAKRKGIV